MPPILPDARTRTGRRWAGPGRGRTLLVDAARRSGLREPVPPEWGAPAVTVTHFRKVSRSADSCPGSAGCANSVGPGRGPSLFLNDPEGCTAATRVDMLGW
ncbi:hypothetical protein GCM10027073_07340 [Streptomyces chlorus]